MASSRRGGLQIISSVNHSKREQEIVTMRGIEIKEYVKVSSVYPTVSSVKIKLEAHAQKSPKELRVTELPDPVPKKDDEYLIQVHATAANFFDILQIQGKYQTQPRK